MTNTGCKAPRRPQLGVAATNGLHQVGIPLLHRRSLSSRTGTTPHGVVFESSTTLSANLGATQLTVYAKLALTSSPLSSEMVITMLVQTVSWLAASAATLQVSEAPELEDHAGAVIATASCGSVAKFMTTELARVGSVMPLSAPLGLGKGRASRTCSPPRHCRRQSRRPPSVSGMVRIRVLEQITGHIGVYPKYIPRILTKLHVEREFERCSRMQG